MRALRRRPIVLSGAGLVLAAMLVAGFLLISGDRSNEPAMAGDDMDEMAESARAEGDTGDEVDESEETDAESAESGDAGDAGDADDGDGDAESDETDNTGDSGDTERDVEERAAAYAERFDVPVESAEAILAGEYDAEQVLALIERHVPDRYAGSYPAEDAGSDAVALFTGDEVPRRAVRIVGAQSIELLAGAETSLTGLRNLQARVLADLTATFDCEIIPSIDVMNGTVAFQLSHSVKGLPLPESTGDSRVRVTYA